MDTEATMNMQEQMDKTAAVPAPGAEATMIGAPVVCAVCKTENAPTEKYCGECGFLLSSTPGEAVELPDTSTLPALVEATGGREHILRDGENTVGREGADVLLADATVSRRHALLVLEEGRAWLEDVGSTNGTFAAGSQVNAGERVEVTDATEIKFGSVVLSLSLPSAPETVEPKQVGEEQPAIEEEQPGSEAVETPEAELPPAPAPVARLISLEDRERIYDILPGTSTIGRRSGNNIVLEDAYVSGSHAEIIADDDGFWLTDVGSTNGTVLNGEKLVPNDRKPLSPGDKVVFGRMELEFGVLEQPEL